MLNLRSAFVYFRWSWSWSCHFGLGLVSSGLCFGLGHLTLVLVLVLRIWSCLHHCCTPLWLAAANLHTDVVRALVFAGADVNTQTNDG